MYTTDPNNAKKQVTAVLGPTNTGKTYMAIETMLGFERDRKSVV